MVGSGRFGNAKGRKKDSFLHKSGPNLYPVTKVYCQFWGSFGAVKNGPIRDISAEKYANNWDILQCKNCPIPSVPHRHKMGNQELGKKISATFENRFCSLCLGHIFSNHFNLGRCRHKPLRTFRHLSGIGIVNLRFQNFKSVGNSSLSLRNYWGHITKWNFNLG